MNFSERLKELRAEKQCTQRHLAYFLGLTANSICEWENNRCEPSIATLLKISEFFDVSIDYLIGRTDDFGTPTSAPADNGLTSEERKLVEDYRKLNVYKKELIRNSIKAMLPADKAESKQKKYNG